MLQLDDYKITEQIYSGNRSSLFRGIRLADNTPVIVKTSTSKFSSIEQIHKFQREYEIGSLFDHPNIIQFYGLEKLPHGYAIITEDYHAVSIEKYLEKKTAVSIDQFLNLAIQIITALHDIHEKKVIFKDLNPNNIVINEETNRVAIIDFGISTQLELESKQGSSLTKLEGTLQYMSPEQTGRMNRTIDYRADFYSLGATFYRMLCGEPPHKASDHLEYVHCHIAKEPVPPRERNEKIPEAISNIILKLLNKNAEDRYQSATGLLGDLQQCANEWQENGSVKAFLLGKNDQSEKFHISQQLYGREEELAKIYDLFNQVSKGAFQILTVSGRSGVGKSALVHEIEKSVTSNWGYFSTGKYEKLNRGKAYSAMSQGFQTLIQQILGEDVEQVDSWKEKFLSALGPNGKIIIDLVPALELIIGKQPEVQDLDPVESQNRFNIVFSNFLKAFTQEGQPFVFFLDHMQWSDPASMQLINYLAHEEGLKHLLLILSYRDNEVDDSDPLCLTLNDLEKSGIPLEKIVVKPLDIIHTGHLVADALNSTTQGVLPLTKEIFQKTDGNVFFIKIFLQALHDEKILSFQFGKGWQWNIKKVRQMQAAENVVELMLKKINKFPAATREILKLAACSGSRFFHKDLCLITKKDSTSVIKALRPALNTGMVLELENDFRFVHDRVQEATYSLLSSEEQIETHLMIGSVLLEKIPKERLQERIFDVVDHLNRGMSLIKDEKKCMELSRLNLLAGQKAKRNTAYLAALGYFRCGIERLTKDCWTTDYSLSLNQFKELGDAEYLNGNFEESELIVKFVFEKAKTPIEKAEILCMLIYQYTVRAEYEKGIEVGRDALKLLGITLPQKDYDKALEKELSKARKNLGKREIDSLIDSPELSDPIQSTAMKVLMNIQPTTYMAAPELYSVINVMLANISLKYGHTPESSKAYVNYANTLSSIKGEYQLGYEFCLLGLRIGEKYNDLVQKCRGNFIYLAFLLHWKKHLREGKNAFIEGYQAGIECGDLQYAGYILGFGAANIYYQGIQLDIFASDLSRYSSFVKKTKQQMPIDSIRAFQMAVSNLRGETDNMHSFDMEDMSEKEFIKGCNSRKMMIGVCYFNILKAQILYLYGDYKKALKAIQTAIDNIVFIRGTSAVAEANFYHSLIMAALATKASRSSRQKYLDGIKENQKQMEIWAKNCPENYEHQYLLVEAERERLNANLVAAMDLYDKAIEFSMKQGFIQHEALANERYARFWQMQGKEDFALLHIEYAFQGYKLWGTARKVKLLEEEFLHLKPHHRSHMKTSCASTSLSRTLPSTSTDSGESYLDLSSVIKASQVISGEIVLDTLLEKVMKVVIENAGAQKGLLIQKEGNKLTVVAETSSKIGSIFQRVSIPINKSNELSTHIVHYVERVRENIVLHDAMNDSQFSRDPYVLENKPKSVLCMPIINQGKLVGILYLENNLTTNAFTQNRIEVLQLISSQAAISLENALLYSNLEQLVKERTKKLSNTLSELKNTQQSLIESEKMAALGQLVAGVAHEINTPIGIGVTTASHFQDITKGLNTALTNNELKKSSLLKYIDDAESCSNLILNNLKRTANLIQSFKLVAADQTHYEKRRLNLKNYLDDIFLSLTPVFKKGKKEVKITCPTDIEIKSYPGAIGQIITNFVVNTIQHAYKPGEKGIILVEVIALDSKVQIKYRDFGKGVPKKSTKKIFEPFFTTKRNKGGTGLGLHIVFNLITQTLRGTIECESFEEEGTLFTIILPSQV